MDTFPSLLADECKLEYSWVGPEWNATGAVLVFLHEGLGCIRLWRDFPKQVAQALGLPALIYSRAGYGGSDPVELPRPVTYLHHEAKVVLTKILDHFGIKRAILIGHSDGGSIALIHTSADAGNRIIGTVVMATHVSNEQAAQTSIRRAVEAYKTGSLRGRLAKFHGDNVDCAFNGWSDVWLSKDFQSWNIKNVLPDICVPLLVAQGIDDRYGTLEQVDAIASGTGGPMKKCIIPDCDHSPHIEQPDIMRDAICRFVLGLGI
jgi:pimeloyl-ACP methyl ester carboxylesterase